MKNEELREILKEDSLPISVAEEYLTIYFGNSDWNSHIAKTYQYVYKRFGADQSAEKMKQVISCALLLPVSDKSIFVDKSNPQNLLLKVPYYHQLGERDWFSDLREIIRKDVQVEGCRLQLLGLGYIDPITYAPISRQAFNWLYNEAERSECITPETKEDIVVRFSNLVKAYGGLSICNVFSRHKESLKKVFNWRTGYFFQHVLLDVYTPEQLMKIKKTELEQANPKLVKKLVGV